MGHPRVVRNLAPGAPVEPLLDEPTPAPVEPREVRPDRPLMRAPIARRLPVQISESHTPTLHVGM